MTTLRTTVRRRPVGGDGARPRRRAARAASRPADHRPKLPGKPQFPSPVIRPVRKDSHV